MFKKFATIITAMAIAMAFTMTAHAQTTGSPLWTTSFSGLVNRYDKLPAQLTVTGSLLAPYPNYDPLQVHFTDGYNDFWCSAPDAIDTGLVTITTNTGALSGTVTIDVSKMDCVNQHHSDAPISGTGTVVFWWSFGHPANTYNYSKVHLQGKSINVSFPCSPSCLYYSFNGIGDSDNT